MTFAEVKFKNSQSDLKKIIEPTNTARNMPNEIVATKMEVVYQVDQRYNDDRKVQVKKKERNQQSNIKFIHVYKKHKWYKIKI